MFDEKHFVPVLKFKQGERNALQELPEKVLSRITPLIELDAIPADPDTGENTKSIDDYLRPIPDYLSECLRDKPFFLDPWLIEDFESTSNGSHPVEVLYSEFSEYNVNAIPIVSIDRAVSYTSEAIRIAKAKRTLGIRIEGRQLAPSPGLRIASILDECGLRPSECHLIIDLESIEESLFNIQEMVVGMLPTVISNIDSWQTYTIVGSSFPQSLGDIPAGISFLPRLEWKLYKESIDKGKFLNRIPTFGDYGVNHPFLTEGFDPRKMSASANIRYTVENEWMILKGHSLKLSGFDQYNELAYQLTGKPQYLGPDYSAGDKFIDQCSKGGRTGNPSVWRYVGASHHITFMVDQLASFHAS
ncbi:MAG TPA: beta family protein [Spirochaetia bacterium]|nr:beta family protein [Spirochaetia bacterium]